MATLQLRQRIDDAGCDMPEMRRQEDADGVTYRGPHRAREGEQQIRLSLFSLDTKLWRDRA